MSADPSVLDLRSRLLRSETARSRYVEALVMLGCDRAVASRIAGVTIDAIAGESVAHGDGGQLVAVERHAAHLAAYAERSGR